MKKRSKRSPIWEIPLKEFEDICKTSKTIREIVTRCELQDKGGNRKTVFRRIIDENIDISSIPLGIGSNRNRRVNFEVKPIEYYLIENSQSSRNNIKKRLIKEGLLKNECFICGLKNNWNEKPIQMVLDHMNGISNDYRLENLQLVCPNCNSQLDTFAGKNAKRIEKKKYYCPDCGTEILKTSKRCFKCSGINRRKVANRPERDILLEEIRVYGYVKTGKKYGVSDKAVKKWLQ